MYSCHSILECYDLFSGVKRSFVLFISIVFRPIYMVRVTVMWSRINKRFKNVQKCTKGQTL